MLQSYEAVSRRKAEKLITEFISLHKKLLLVGQQLRKLSPFAREAYLRSLAHSPLSAAQIAWFFFHLSNESVGEYKSAAFNLPPDAPYADVLVLLKEHIASQGWAEQVRELLPAQSPLKRQGW